MTEYIERDAFVEEKRKQYCKDCKMRKGFKGGKYKTLYAIGEGPCRSCGIYDMLNDVEDFPAADVRHVEWIPVTDRLPEDRVPVQVCYIGFLDGKIASDLLACIYEGMWCYWDGFPCGYDKCNVEITHWMPLIEPKED